MLNRRQFLLFSSAILLTACTRYKKIPKISSGDTILALGDSLTAGYGAAKGEDYPSQLAQITGWTVVNGGVSGDTSAQALLRLPDLLQKNLPKLVIVSIGGNDFLRKLPESETRQNITQIIKQIQATNIPVILVAIPYFTPAALVGKVSEHPLYDDLAKELNVPLFKGAWAEMESDTSMKSDTVHGNAKGYRYFAEELADFLKKSGAVCEMISDNPDLQHTVKTRHRQDFSGETGTIVVQIVGSQPEQMAAAAHTAVTNGAEVIDINMGCPVKKVCNVFSGSALLQNEPLVNDILNAVVQAVDVPVTLKTRLGWDDEHLNIPTVAQMAQDAGIAALTIHGRTRTQLYRGEAKYDLISQIKQQINIPVWANGDIISPQKAAQVLAQTHADAIVLGRAAQGQPWLFADIQHYLQFGQLPPPMRFQTAADIATQHIASIHQFYGENLGHRIARKHIGWYLARLPESDTIRKKINQINHASQQLDELVKFFKQREKQHEFWFRDYGE